jgi:hypothetical protein
VTVNQRLLSDLVRWYPRCNHVIQVTSYSGAHDNQGNRQLDTATARQYRCLIQSKEDTSWATAGATDDWPFVAYILSVPINGFPNTNSLWTDAYPIHKEEQLQVITPSYITLRFIGRVMSSFNEWGDLHNIMVTFR